MPDNYERILDFIEKSTDGLNIDSEEFNELMKGLSSFDKRELVIYCQTKLKKVRKQLAFRNFNYAMLGGLLAIILYLPLSYFFPEIIGNNSFQILLILPCVYLVFELRPKNHPLVKQKSKYMKFKSKFSSN